MNIKKKLKTIERFWPWQCPNCKEWLQDPLRIRSTQCHCGQGVNLGDIKIDDTRHVTKRSMQEPTGMKNLSKTY